MMPVKQLSIATIGDEDLVNGLRLAGIRKYYVIADIQNGGEETRKALNQLLDEPGLGIIVIQEDYVKHVEDIIAQFRQKRQPTPIILEVPSKYGTRYQDVTGYYKARIREFIGFDVEI